MKATVFFFHTQRMNQFCCILMNLLLIKEWLGHQSISAKLSPAQILHFLIYKLPVPVSIVSIYQDYTVSVTYIWHWNEDTSHSVQKDWATTLLAPGFAIDCRGHVLVLRAEEEIPWRKSTVSTVCLQRGIYNPDSPEDVHQFSRLFCRAGNPDVDEEYAVWRCLRGVELSASAFGYRSEEMAKSKGQHNGSLQMSGRCRLDVLVGKNCEKDQSLLLSNSSVHDSTDCLAMLSSSLSLLCLLEFYSSLFQKLPHTPESTTPSILNLHNHLPPYHSSLQYVVPHTLHRRQILPTTALSLHIHDPFDIARAALLVVSSRWIRS